MKKKILGVLLTLVFAVTGFGLVGCGGGSNPAPGPGPGPGPEPAPEVSYDDDTTPVAIDETNLVFVDAYDPYERGLNGTGGAQEEDEELEAFQGAKMVVGLVEAAEEVVIPAYVVDEDENVYVVTQLGEEALTVYEEEEIELLGDVEDEEEFVGVVKVTIPSTVTYVDREAFNGCYTLEEIVLNNRETVIDGLYYLLKDLLIEYTDEGYTQEEVLALLNTDESEELYYLGNPGNPYMYLVCAGESYWPEEEPEEGHELVANVHANCKVIGEGALANSVVTDVVLPNGLKAIGPGAFFNCDGLEYIEIPTTVEYIGWHIVSEGTVLYVDHDLPDCGALVVYVLKTLVDAAEEGVYPFDNYEPCMTYDEEAQENIARIENHNNKEYYGFCIPIE